MTVAEAAAAYGIRLRPAVYGDNLIKLTRRIYGDDNIRYRSILLALNRRFDWYHIPPGDTIYFIEPSLAGQIDSFMTFDDIIAGGEPVILDLAAVSSDPPVPNVYTYRFEWHGDICQKEELRPLRNTGNVLKRFLRLVTLSNDVPYTEEDFNITAAFNSYIALTDAQYQVLTNDIASTRGSAFISYIASLRGLDSYSVVGSNLVQDHATCPLPPVVITETVEFSSYICQAMHTGKAFAELVTYKKYVDDVLTISAQKSILLDVSPPLTEVQYQALTEGQVTARANTAIALFNPVGTPAQLNTVVVEEVDCEAATASFTWSSPICQTVGGSNTGYELYTTLTGTVTRGTTPLTGISYSIKSVFDTYPALTDSEWAAYTSADATTRADALVAYAVAQYPVTISSYTSTNTVVNHNEVDCVVSNVYVFTFEDGTTEQEHTIEYNGTFTDTIISTKNGQDAPYTVQSKPDWAAISINENQATYSGENQGEYREGTVVYIQTESGATIITTIKQYGQFASPTLFTLGLGKWISTTSPYYPGPPAEYSVEFDYEVKIDGTLYAAGSRAVALGSDTPSDDVRDIDISGYDHLKTIEITISAPGADYPGKTISVEYGGFGTYSIVPGYIESVDVQADSVTIVISDKGGRLSLGEFKISPVITVTASDDYEFEWSDYLCQQEAVKPYKPINSWAYLPDYTNLQEPTSNLIQMDSASNQNYSNQAGGLPPRIYNTYSLAGTGSDYTQIATPASDGTTSNHWWYTVFSERGAYGLSSGRLNAAGVKTQGTNSWDYTLPIQSGVAKSYYMYAAADNYFRIYINGTLILQRDSANEADWTTSEGVSLTVNFVTVYIWKINLLAGENTIRIAGENLGGSPLGVAVEIYDIELADLIISLTPKGEAKTVTEQYMAPKIIFSTKPYRTGVTSNTCASGWTLAFLDDVPVCTQGGSVLTNWFIQKAFVRVTDTGALADKDGNAVVSSGLRPAIAVVDVMYPSYVVGDYLRIDNVEYQISEIIQAPDLITHPHNEIFYWNKFECIKWIGA